MALTGAIGAIGAMPTPVKEPETLSSADFFDNVATNTADYIGKNYVTLPKNCEKKRHGTDMRNRWPAAAL